MSDMIEKAPDAYRTISEVADDLDIPQHVLRFWETRFSQIRPLKRGGGRRYYRPDDVALIKGIRALLYGQGYTIRGVQRILKDQGIKHVQGLGRGTVEAPLRPAPAEAPAAALTSHDEAMERWSGEDAEEDATPAARPAGEAPGPSPSAPQPVLSPDARRRLEAALADLTACRRLVAAARQA